MRYLYQKIELMRQNVIQKRKFILPFYIRRELTLKYFILILSLKNQIRYDNQLRYHSSLKLKMKAKVILIVFIVGKNVIAF